MNRFCRYVLAGAALLFFAACAARVQWPGQLKDSVLLPNRWVLTPVGNQIPVGDLPLNMALAPNGGLLAVTNNGYSRQFISLIDTRTDSVTAELPIAKGFYGIVFSPDGRFLYASGGADERILVWRMNGASATPDSAILLKGQDAPAKLFPSGIAVSRDGGTLYVAENRGDCVSEVSTGKRTVERRIPTPAGSFPYDVRLVQSRSKLYVSLWGGSAVSVIDSRAFAVKTSIPVGDHPNAMLVNADESLLYVACANTDEVWVIDTVNDKVVETIGLHPYPNAPYGSTPNGLALSSDGSVLYVANATNNDVAVVDVSKRGASVIRGLIPVGWYPTALAVAHDGGKLYAANGKGLISKPNPKGPNPLNGKGNAEYIGGLFNGVVSSIRYRMRRHSIMRGQRKTTVSTRRIASARAEKSVKSVPCRAGRGKNVAHQTRNLHHQGKPTNDQLFGDIAKGTAIPLLHSRRDITPNHQRSQRICSHG